MCTTRKLDFDPSPKKKAALESCTQEQRSNDIFAALPWKPNSLISRQKLRSMSN
jgi:hypothetical protein